MYKLTCIFILFCKVSFSQNQDIKGLIEYVHQDSAEIIANIIIPSFETEMDETIPTITIEIKDVLWFELRYKYRPRAGKAIDTCFVGLYDEKYWEGEGIEPVFSENVCSGDFNDIYCSIIITNKKTYIVRFRKGKTIRSYRLIVK